MGNLILKLFGNLLIFYKKEIYYFFKKGSSLFLFLFFFYYFFYLFLELFNYIPLYIIDFGFIYICWFFCALHIYISFDSIFEDYIWHWLSSQITRIFFYFLSIKFFILIFLF